MDSSNAQFSTLGKVVAAVALIGLGYLLARSPIAPPIKAPTTTKATDSTTTTADIKNIKTDGAVYIGNANAPVTIAYWSDYQCPFCKKFETETMPNVIKDYVTTGKVRVLLKDFQFLGRDSTTAALYARAVWELYPDRYFEWREAMYNAQDAENNGFGDEASIEALTSKISGLDAGKLAKLATDKAAIYQAAIDADKAEASSVGITGTPGVLIGTKVIPGAVAYTTIQPLLDAQLKTQ